MTITCNACKGGRCHLPSTDSSYRPVIAIAGLSCETSTFTHARTNLPAFQPLRGQAVVDDHDFLDKGTRFGDAAEWRGALTAYALPGGIVTRNAFEVIAAEIVDRLERILRETSLDGLWYDIHGAMHVEGLDDCESELLRRIRQVIGWSVAISTSMDLHGNVSQKLVEQTDLITCYRTAPHEDVNETKERACHNLVNLLRDRYRYETDCKVPAPWPIKAWIPIPILLPGEQTSTRLEPATSIYALVRQIESRRGIIDASVWVGYAWADERRSHASVVITGWSKSAVRQGAEELAKLFWLSREKFHFVAPTASFDECFDKALTSTSRPYFISDSGDNPTAGGSGDVTWTLRRLISLLKKHRDVMSISSRFVYASLPSPGAVANAVEAGLGSHVTVTVEAGIDDDLCDSLILEGVVCAIKHGDADAETEVVLEMAELPIFVILTKLRKPYHFEHDFTDLNLDISKENANAIVIVKIGYLEPELFALSKGWMLVLTPGGVDQDLPRLGHRKIVRPMWPFDKHFKNDPDLTARIVGRGGETYGSLKK